MTTSPVETYTEAETRRILARRSPYDFGVVVSGTRKVSQPDGSFKREPRWQGARHLRLISNTIAPCIDRSVFVIITAPPRHGKSQESSRIFPAWVLGHRPEWNVVLGSYSDSFAQEHGEGARVIALSAARQKLFDDLEIRSDRGGAGRWYTTQGGGMTSVGMKGSLTGRGANVLIIDDPIKDKEQAQSEVHRQKTWDWFTAAAFTRLEPGGSVIILLTRWHEDDIVGRILADPDLAELFTVVNLVALPDPDDVPNDPLGRAVDEPLWPERFPHEILDRIRRVQKKAGNWDSMYQGRPAPPEGKIFKRKDLRYWTPMQNPDGETVYNLGEGKLIRAADCVRIVTCDPALTDDQSNDPTVIQVWDIAPNADMILVANRRAWLDSTEVVPAVTSVYNEYRPELVGVESAAFGLAVIKQARRDGIPIIELKAEKDKVARATTASTKMESGQVFFERYATYLDDLIPELLTFNNGLHDDQVDCFGYAAIEAQKRAFNWGDAYGLVDCAGCGHKYVRKPEDRPCPKCGVRQPPQ